MTAEIAILNKQAVALAADSAVTFSGATGQKIFPSANKIFTLSKYHPVGVMVYGDSQFMSIPWETVIKLYRRNLGTTSFDSLDEYVDDFIAFLTSRFSDESVESQYVEEIVIRHFAGLRHEIDKSMEALERIKEETLSQNEIKRISKIIIKNQRNEWADLNPTPGMPDDMGEYIKEHYWDIISEIRKKIFKGILTPVSSRWVGEVALNVITKFPADKTGRNISGIVLAGFGDNDVFPVLRSYYVDAIIGETLKYCEHRSSTISPEMIGHVIPFAQKEMVQTFMTGVDPELHSLLDSFIRRVVMEYPDLLLDQIEGVDKEELKDLSLRLKRIGASELRKYRKEISEYQHENYINPIVSVISMLPKDELAAAAEAFVNITSVRRRFSTQSETVGGPVDVAVISKGDGFVWIRRKHYFDAELNPYFTEKYFDDFRGTS